MLSKKWFTLTEILTTVAITSVVFWWVSMSISSFQNTSEIFSWEKIFTSKIRSEKVSAISWEINCSKTSLFYWKNFFEIFHWTEKNFSCEKKFFWKIIEKNSEIWKIFINFYKNLDDIEIQIFANWWKWWEIYPDIISNKQISFDLKDDFSYKITAQQWDEIEELEIIFFNDNPWKLAKETEDFWWLNLNKIIINKIYWTNFKKEEISWDTLSIIFTNSNPKSKLILRWQEVNNANISLKTLGWEKQSFNFFSASLFWGKNILDIWEILEN